MVAWLGRFELLLRGAGAVLRRPAAQLERRPGAWHEHSLAVLWGIVGLQHEVPKAGCVHAAPPAILVAILAAPSPQQRGKRMRNAGAAAQNPL